jgi:hypothetical protein
MTLELVADHLARDERGVEYERTPDGKWVRRRKPRAVKTKPKPAPKRAPRRRRNEYASPERTMIESRRPPPAPVVPFIPEPYEPGEMKAWRERLRALVDAERRARVKGTRNVDRELEALANRE